MELASRQTVDMMTVEHHHAREKNSQSQGKEDSQVECGLFFSWKEMNGEWKFHDRLHGHVRVFHRGLFSSSP